MKFKLLMVVLVAGLVGGGAYAVRTYRHNADPAVKAERLAEQGKLRDAMVELRNAMRDRPREAELHVRIADLHSKLADPVAAEKEYRIALGLGADRNQVAPLLGEVVLVQGRYRDVLREVPSRAPSKEVLAKNLLLRAVAQLSLQDVPAAEQTLAQGQAEAPEQAEVALIAARVAAARDDFATMTAKVAEVLKLDPNQVEALLMQEKILTLEGDRKGALALTDRAVKNAPWSAMARLERANQLIYAGDDKRAQNDVNAVLEAQPRFIDAVYLNGILMARRGQYAEAAAQLEKLDAVSARIPQGLYYQSLIALQQGNTQTSAEFARRYAALVPADPDGQRQLARTELALNRPANALPPLLKLLAEQQAAEAAKPGAAAAVAPASADAPTGNPAAGGPEREAELFDMLGRAYAGMDRRPEAGTAFARALALRPDDPLIRYHMGAQQLQSGQFADAFANLGRAFDADPRIAGSGPALVSAALGVGDLARADTAVARMREITGDTDELAQMSASIRVQQGDLPGARTILTEAARKFPNSADVRIQLAQVLIRQAQPNEAGALLSAVLAKEPTKLTALTTFIALRASENDLPGSIKALETAHQSAPRNTAITSMLADGLTVAGQAGRAIDVVRETAADNALPPLLAAALGRAQLASGRIAEARATYAAILKANPGDLMVRGSYASLLTGEKDFAEVRSTLEEGLAASPGNYPLMSGLVANEMRWKGVEAAVKLADDLRARPGTMPYAALLKGDLYQELRRPADAGKAYLAEYTQKPALPLLLKAVSSMAAGGQDDQARAALEGWLKDNPKDAEVAQRLAQLDIKAERYAAAQAHLAVVLEARPNDALALNNLAWSYLMSNDKRALPTAQRAYLQDPSAATGDTLGWILVRDGSAKAAVPVLQRAAGLRPGDRSIQYHLAAALAQDGKPGEAASLLQSLAGGPAFEEQGAARKLLVEVGSKSQ